VNLWWASLLVLASAAVAVAVLLLIRRFSPHGGHFGDTGRAAGVFSILATSFAVLFAFVVFLSFDAYSSSSDSADVEAQAVSQQFEMAQYFPASVSPKIGAELVCYGRSVVHQEWPAMANARPPGINQWAGPLFVTVKSVNPTTPQEQAAFAKWLDLETQREQARQGRIVGKDGVIPAPVWFVLLVSAAIVLGFVFLFADRGEGSFVQAALVASVTAMIVSGLLVINFLDNPYTPGSGSLHPTAMVETLDRIDQASTLLHIDLPALCDRNGQPIKSGSGG
jgi:hypothetical protein